MFHKKTFGTTIEFINPEKIIFLTWKSALVNTKKEKRDWTGTQIEWRAIKYTNTVQRLGILKLYTFIYYENWNSYIK